VATPRRVLKWAAAVLGLAAVLLAVLIGGLHLWLERSTTVVPELVARVEAVTGLTLTFAHLDARLGIYGPELVFRDAHISNTATGVTLATASSGRVGFDFWRALTTGRIASARVSLERAQVHLLLRAGGLELEGTEALHGQDSTGTPLRPDTLPVGHLLLVDGVVIVHDLRPDGRAWRIDGVKLDLERDATTLKLSGLLPMPSSLGGRLLFAGRAAGDLGSPATLSWQASASADSVRLAGWKGLLPSIVRLPSNGYGSLRGSAEGTGAQFQHTELAFDLASLVLPADEGAPPARLEALAGRLQMDRQEGRYSLQGRGLTVRAGKQLWTRGEIDGGLEYDAGVLQSVWLRTPELKLEILAMLVPLVPGEGLRAQLEAMAPTGLVTDVDLAVRHGSAAGEWGIAGKARFLGLSFGAHGKMPGFGTLDGDLAASGSNGRAHLSSHHFVLHLPEYLRGPVGADAGQATLDWWWRPDGWRFATDDLAATSHDGRSEGKARLFIPADPDESPRLVLDLHLHDGDVRSTPKYLPGRKIPLEAMNWLDAAFVAGHLTEGRLEYAGETRRFPFRDGGGQFRVRGHIEGAHLHYAPGWPDLEAVNCDVDFKNEGFTARGSAGSIAGITIGESTVSMADFKDARLIAAGHASGDLRRGLWFVQHSPLATMLGPVVAGLAGHGAMGVAVKLDLPIHHFADRLIEVETSLEHAAVTVPGVPGEFADLNGTLTIRNLDVETPELTALAFGGSLRLEAHTQEPKQGLHVTTLQAQGSAGGAALQTLSGVSSPALLQGATDWRLQLRVPHLEWRRDLPLKEAAAASGGRSALQSKWLPASLHVEAPLSGLEVRLPAPLRKAAPETRLLRADLVLDPGVVASEPDPPRSLASHEPARPASVSVRAQLGRDSAVLELRRRAPRGAGPPATPDLELRRGVLRFGGGTPALREGAGLWLEGRVPEFDLAGWLHLDTGNKKDAPGMATWLRGGQLTVDRLDAFGYALSDLGVQFQPEATAWRIDVDGAMARGLLSIPFELHGADPIVISLERLIVGAHQPGTGGPATGMDPATLPSLAVDVKTLEVDQRRLGSLSARLVHAPQGLTLDRAELKGSSFTVTAQGEWSGVGDAQHCAVNVSAESHDLGDTLAAMAFAPTLTGKSGHAHGELHWQGGIDGSFADRLAGKLEIDLQSGQILNVQPGAGRVLGLLSVAALPRRLSLDFRDLTGKGFAFDTIKGDFEFRDGNAYTDDLVVKGPAAEIGIAGRTGLKERDYDQTAAVTGHFGGPAAVVGALAFGPAAGAALLLFSKVFKGPLSGFVRGYYHITGPWDHPKVERIGASEARIDRAQGEPPPPGDGVAAPPER
jgi:uncharacterized protein (TIGR02099 family)